MTETANLIHKAIDEDLEQINLAVAVIAGWTDIKEWDRKALKKAFVGTNKSHPELGIFVPNYIESIDAIAKVLLHFQLPWHLVVAWDGRTCASSKDSKRFNGFNDSQVGSTPAIALCKLLIAISPTIEKPEPEIAVIEAVFV